MARNDPAAAERLIARIFERVDGLADYPASGRPGRLLETRELVIVGTPFLVPYRVRADQIEILAVLHGARVWPEKFD